MVQSHVNVGKYSIHIPKLFTILKWAFLLTIAIVTALVGVVQSMVVSWLYMWRSTFIYSIVQADDNAAKKFFQYTGFNLLLAFTCCMALYIISPAASGSGIPDIKAFLNGVENPAFKNFFTVKTFIAKVIGAATAVASSLVMGKEGPMLHVGSAVAVQLGGSQWFKMQMDKAMHWGTYTYHLDLRDLVACGAACGVCTAFKAPVGGVFFAMEMSTRWRKELTWRCFLACAVSIVVVRECVIKCIALGHCSNLKWGSLIWFQQTFPTPYDQAWAMVIIAVIGGWAGCMFTAFNTWVCIIRKRWAKWFKYRIGEVCAISVFTSIIFYTLPAAGRCRPCDNTDPVHCKAGNAAFHTFQGYHCEANAYNDMAVLIFNPQGFVIQALFTASSDVFSMGSLVLYAMFFWFLAAVTYGAFIPSGLFTPSLIFGGCLGRLYAEILVHIGVANESDVGMYALLGAAAFLGGLMRMSASMCLILMEMTAAPNQLPFLMLVLIIAKGVGDRFNYSVFDHQMMLKSFPFIGNVSERAFKRARMRVSNVMTKNDHEGAKTLYLTESGETLAKALANDTTAVGFAVVELSKSAPTGASGNFVGIISREHIKVLLDRHGQDATNISLLEFVEAAPVVVPPDMPLAYLYEVVQNLGLNFVPVVQRHGPMEGIVSRFDLYKVQNEKLDKLHLKEHIDELVHDIEEGRILESMKLHKHTEGLKTFVQNPLQVINKIQTFMHEDDEILKKAVADESKPMIYLVSRSDDPAFAAQPAPLATAAPSDIGIASSSEATAAISAGVVGQITPAAPSTRPADGPQQTGFIQ